MTCACGCGRKRGLQRHHAVYQQTIRRAVLAEHRAAGNAGPPPITREMALLADRRNIVMLGPKCHAAHHNRSQALPLRVLPDSVYEFAIELLGRGPAYEFLRRRYTGKDWRLDELLGEPEA